MLCRVKMFVLLLLYKKLDNGRLGMCAKADGCSIDKKNKSVLKYLWTPRWVFLYTTLMVSHHFKMTVSGLVYRDILNIDSRMLWKWKFCRESNKISLMKSKQSGKQFQRKHGRIWLEKLYTTVQWIIKLNKVKNNLKILLIIIIFLLSHCLYIHINWPTNFS
jgi:hypothetical protein